MKLCSDRYRFKISKVMMGDFQYDVVIKRYCREESVDENCVRPAQFLVQRTHWLSWLLWGRLSV